METKIITVRNGVEYIHSEITEEQLESFKTNDPVLYEAIAKKKVPVIEPPIVQKTSKK